MTALSPLSGFQSVQATVPVVPHAVRHVGEIQKCSVPACPNVRHYKAASHNCCPFSHATDVNHPNHHQFDSSDPLSVKVQTALNHPNPEAALSNARSWDHHAAGHVSNITMSVSKQPNLMCAEHARHGATAFGPELHMDRGMARMLHHVSHVTNDKARQDFLGRDPRGFMNEEDFVRLGGCYGRTDAAHRELVHNVGHLVG